MGERIMKKGDKIGIVACSNGLKESSSPEMEQLKITLENLGLTPVFSEYLYAKDGAESGTRQQRAEALMKFYRDEEIKGIFDVSGGDLANGVLPWLDYETIAKSGKAFWGYSDLTTVVNAITAKTGKPSVLYQIRNLIYQDGEWGVYSGEFRVLMNVPLSIASCLAPSVVPSLAAVMSDNDTKEASIKVRDTIRYTMILTIPCAVGFLALSSPIMQLIFSDSTELASGIMQTGSLLIVLLGLSTLTTGILQGLGRMKEPMIHSAIALVLHLILLAVLMTVFKLNIYGVLYSNIFFGLIMCILNAISIKKYLRYRQELVRTFIIPLVSSGIMGLAAYGVYNLCHLAVGNAISCLAAILVAIVVYGVVLIKLRGITERELYAIPKGAILVGVLKKCRLL